MWQQSSVTATTVFQKHTTRPRRMMAREVQDRPINGTHGLGWPAHLQENADKNRHAQRQNKCFVHLSRKQHRCDPQFDVTNILKSEYDGTLNAGSVPHHVKKKEKTALTYETRSTF